MADRFDIHVFPACEGDCFWLRYGSDDDRHNILIDGGLEETAALVCQFAETLPPAQRKLDLLVVTHIDRDHIEGVLELFAQPGPGIEVDNIWYNGRHHLHGEPMGIADAEKLSSLITSRGWPWNDQFGGRAVRLPADGMPVTLNFPEGMQVTVLSPDVQKLRELLNVWPNTILEAGLVPGQPPPEPPPGGGLQIMGSIDIEEYAGKKYSKDTSKTNGSSIALLFEYRGKSALFAGDAHADLLVKSLQALAGVNGRSRPLHVDLFKVSHHGSAKNTNKTLLQNMACNTYLLSTDGSGKANHPNPEAMARIIKFGGANKTLIFNYHSEESEIWDNGAWQESYSYRTTYPEQNDTVCQTIRLLEPE
jgi:hypothetical protein